jgi:hypothetical protein
MNDRIQELMKKSMVNTPDMSRPGRKELDPEKFAELIVQECINKIEAYQIPVGNSAAGEMACKWTYDALKEIREEIRELLRPDQS